VCYVLYTLCFFQEIGVIGAYATAISVVLISVCITVFTTKEKPGKEVKEPVGKDVLVMCMNILHIYSFTWLL